MADGRRLLVFDLTAHIHLPAFLEFLVTAWAAEDRPGALDLLVHPSFLTQHADVVARGAAARRGRVRFLTISDAEHRQRRAHELQALDPRARRPLTSFASLVRGSVETEALSYDWRLLQAYAGRLRPDGVLIVHLDTYLPLLAGGLVPPAALAGIFFNPRFHQIEAGEGDERPAPLTLHQKFLLARTLRQPAVRRVFFLDPFAAEAARGMPHGEKVRYLPDPVPANTASPAAVAALRARLGVDAQRRVLLMFGHLTPRKGCDGLLAALAQVPADICRSLSLVLAGPLRRAYEPTLEAGIAALCAARPLQCIRQYGYVPQEEVATYFRLADLVLAPYPNHTASSGIVLLAAAAQRPVLATHRGLAGAFVRRHRLGLAVDATRPEAIAAAVARWHAGLSPDDADPAEMRRFADAHAVQHFTTAVLDAFADTAREDRP